MAYTHPKLERRFGATWRLLAAAVSAVAMMPAAHATNYTETTDWSNDPRDPKVLGDLTLGSNIITGTIDTFGPHVGPHGERTDQDQDFVTVTIPTGYALTHFLVSEGTSIFTTADSPDIPPRNDSLFLGLYKNPYTPVAPSFTSAKGLLGWTLVTQAELGTDILPSISNPLKDPNLQNFPVPGATTFTPPLGAGTYTLWFYDGDERARYSFNAVLAAAVPEPGTWTTMIAGFGLIGVGLRRRSRPIVRATYA